MPLNLSLPFLIRRQHRWPQRFAVKMKKVIVVKHIERCGTVSGIQESPGDRLLSVSTMDSRLPWLLGAFDRRSLSSLQLSWLCSLVNTVSIPLRGQGLSGIQRPLCSLCFFKSRLKISKLTKLISSLRSRVFTQNPGSRTDLSSVSEAYTMYLFSSSGERAIRARFKVYPFLALLRLPGWLHWLLYSGPDLSRSCFLSMHHFICLLSQESTTAVSRSGLVFIPPRISFSNCPHPTTWRPYADHVKFPVD